MLSSGWSLLLFQLLFSIKVFSNFLMLNEESHNALHITTYSPLLKVLINPDFLLLYRTLGQVEKNIIKQSIFQFIFHLNFTEVSYMLILAL